MQMYTCEDGNRHRFRPQVRSVNDSAEQARQRVAARCELRLISQTLRLGGMMISEVSNGKAKFHERVQG